jgi:formylmethanofuran dehydrogenase subunit C
VSKISLTLRQAPEVPLEVEQLTPDALGQLSNAQIRALPVQLGKRRLPLGDFFDVEGERSEDLEIHGDLSRLKWIGRQMTCGQITIHGNVGMHLGAYMEGGSLEVHGRAGDWVGAEMKGGLIRVHGDAGGQVGAAYRGSMAGMRNGAILIDGSAGLEVGMRMKKGTIVIGGPAKDFAGLEMKGGNIVLLAGAEIRTGAWMKRGTIISLAPLAMLPTFSRACSYRPAFLGVYAAYLSRLGVTLPLAASEGAYERYWGDSSVPGAGEILIWSPASAA